MVRKSSHNFTMETLKKVEDAMADAVTFKPYALYEKFRQKPNWNGFLAVVEYLEGRDVIVKDHSTGVYTYVGRKKTG